MASTTPSDDEASKFSSHDGALSWKIGHGTSEILDENIICVTTYKDNSSSYRILSTGSIETTSQTPYRLLELIADNLPESFLERHLLKDLPAYLQPDNEIYILISTLSGTGLAESFFDDVLRQVLLLIGLEQTQYTIFKTSDPNSVIELARDQLLPAAAKGTKQTILLLSGDGGIVDTVNGLLEGGRLPSGYTRPNLVQLPLGTGNALFHSLHKPASVAIPSLYVQALRTLLNGTPKPLPLFRATFSPGARLLINEARTETPLKSNTLYGAVVASCGFHSTLVADSDTTEYRKHGDKRFGLVANDLLFPSSGAPHGYLAEVTLSRNGHREVIRRSEHGYVLATLVSNLEKTFTISPESKPFDRALRVVHFGALSGDDTMNVMKAAYDSGKHVQREDVGYENVEGLRIDFKEPGKDWKWRRCCIDGLTVGVEEGGWMEVSLLDESEEAINVVADV